MSELKLVENQEPKKVDWKKERVDFYLSHFLRTGRKCPLGYGALLGMMQNLWVKHHGYEDENGVIQFDIPDMADWQREVVGFFRDKWAKDKMNYHFAYLVKHYGKFSVDSNGYTQKPSVSQGGLAEWKKKMGKT